MTHPASLPGGAEGKTDERGKFSQEEAQGRGLRKGRGLREGRKGRVSISSDFSQFAVESLAGLQEVKLLRWSDRAAPAPSSASAP